MVSKVANFSIDLPEAAVAVQISGTFGITARRGAATGPGASTQTRRTATPRTSTRVVSAATAWTQEYAAHRQRFLAEQGYAYTIIDADDLLGPSLTASSRHESRT